MSFYDNLFFFRNVFPEKSALYLHNLIDREYNEICVYVPTVYNVTHLCVDNLKVKYVARVVYELGVCAVASSRVAGLF